MELKDGLKYILINKGRDVLADPMALKSMLLDLCPEHTIDISILVHTSSDHYFDDLASCDASDIPNAIRTASYRMKESYAESAVDRINSALLCAFDIAEETVEESENVKKQHNHSDLNTVSAAQKKADQLSDIHGGAIGSTSEQKETGKKPVPENTSGADDREDTPPEDGKVSWWKNLYLYEKVLLITLVVSMVGVSIVNPQKDPEYTLDLILNALIYIPLLLSFTLRKATVKKSRPHGILITVLVIGLFAGVCMDFVSKGKLLDYLRIKSGEEAHTRYLWQQHLALEDLILLPGLGLLCIQQIRHRIIERRH